MFSLIPHLAVWLHDIDPYEVDLKWWEGGPVRWYGLSYVLGFFIAYLAIRRVARVGISSIQPQRAADLVLPLAIGIVLGGRLGYVLFYQPSLLWKFTSAIPFWGVLAINEGGMASHGGMLGGLLAALWYARRYQLSGLFALDLLAFSTPLGLFFGRLANFVNGELIGHECDPAFWLAVQFPQEILHWTSSQQEKLAEAVSYLGVSAEAWRQQLVSTAPEVRQFVDARLGELIGETQRSGAVSAQIKSALELVLTPRHPSQIYAAVLEGLVVFGIQGLAWLRPRKPGTIGGTFLLSYGVLRIINELFREPDAHIANLEAGTLGITRGQLLSVCMIISGMLLLWVVWRRQDAPMGSWRRGSWTVEGTPEEPASRRTEKQKNPREEKGS